MFFTPRVKQDGELLVKLIAGLDRYIGIIISMVTSFTPCQLLHVFQNPACWRIELGVIPRLNLSNVNMGFPSIVTIIRSFNGVSYGFIDTIESTAIKRLIVP